MNCETNQCDMPVLYFFAAAKVKLFFSSWIPSLHSPAACILCTVYTSHLQSTATNGTYLPAACGLYLSFVYIATQQPLTAQSEDAACPCFLLVGCTSYLSKYSYYLYLPAACKIQCTATTCTIQ
jgi:hypothetical protein